MNYLIIPGYPFGAAGWQWSAANVLIAMAVALVVWAWTDGAR